MICECVKIQNKEFSSRLYGSMTSIKNRNSSNNKKGKTDFLDDVIIFGGWKSFDDFETETELFETTVNHRSVIFPAGVHSRSQLSCCLHGNEILVFGGVHEHIRLLKINVLNWECSEVIPLGFNLENIFSHTACIVSSLGQHELYAGPYMLIYGGTNWVTTFSTIWAISLSNYHCSRLQPEFPPDELLYLFHGASSSDMHVRGCTPKKPPARLYHASCMVRDRYMYIFGGAPDAKNTTEDDPVFNDLWCFDCKFLFWREICHRKNAPSKRGSTSMCFVDPHLIFFGGFDGVKEHNDLYSFDVDLEVWERISLENPPSERCAHSAALVAPLTILLGGGCNVDSQTSLNDYYSITFNPPSLKELVARHIILSKMKYKP